MKHSDIPAELARKAVNTIRFLAADGVQKANSGHPGLPMGMADCAFVLWTRFLRYNPADPEWKGRDRFILSAGHGSMLLYAMLHLSGYDVTMEDLKSFRQWGSRTPGHPEVGCLPGVETTTGPLGQGFANGVGMAIAAKMTAARYNTPDHELFGKHSVFAVVSDGDLMEGVASEAASLAGHLKLDNLVYMYDDNGITIDGSTSLAFSESVKDRFEAYGWKTLSVDGHDHTEIASALETAVAGTEAPTLIIGRTHIGFGSPNKQDTASVHGSPLGEEELRLTKKNLGWPEDKMFYIPDDVQELFRRRAEELLPEYSSWQAEFAAWEKKNPGLAKRYHQAITKHLPDHLEKELFDACPAEPDATRSISGKMIQKLSVMIPALNGGSADLAPSNNTYVKNVPALSAGDFSGRNMHFGIREHAMGGIMNGMALYGGIIPYGGTFLVFSDYMRASVRLAALMEQQVIYVFTHDSIFVGEDGPTHQPVEHIAALRTIPGLVVLRPGDSAEVALSWAYALRRTQGPTALILTRQKLDAIRSGNQDIVRDFARGGYVYGFETTRPAKMLLVATGSELQLAVHAQAVLESEGISTRVISIPSLDLFRKQDMDYRNAVLPHDAKAVLIIETGVTQGWGDITRLPFRVIGLDTFGASAPYKVLAEKYGFTAGNVVTTARTFLAGLK